MPAPPKIEVPQPEVVKVVEPVAEPINQKVAVEPVEEEKEEQIDTHVLEACLEESSDEDSAPTKGKKCKGKGKKGKKGKMPRRAIKNLIRQELEAAVPGIFDKLVKEANLYVEEEPIEEAKGPLVEHVAVECDGCGVVPIKGIRYKCAVCKDFDYCEKCEASLGHDHPFLKIRKADGAPSMIFTVLNDDAKGEPVQQPDWHSMKDAWKCAKEQWKQCKREQAKNCGQEWNEEDCNRKARHFKDMIGGFLNKMGIDTQELRGHHCPRGEWKGKGEYKLRRAQIISNPDNELVCLPGTVVLHDIEIKNNTHWGWKKDCTLGLDSSIEQSDMPIELVNIPMDQIVCAMETFKMTVPITVNEDAKAGLFEFKLRFRGPKGGEFGEPIPIKLRVTEVNEVNDVKVEKAEEKTQEPKPAEPMSHLELVKLAVKLFEQDKLGQTFKEVMDTVTLVKGDADLATKSLQPRQ